jgi:hypothetical protein
MTTTKRQRLTFECEGFVGKVLSFIHNPIY